jgi:hypothetical protein
MAEMILFGEHISHYGEFSLSVETISIDFAVYT